MRQVSVGLMSLAVAFAGLAGASDYTWVSGGSDNNWTTPENWQGGTAFPGAAGDIATVTTADTVHLNTNGIVTLGRLQFTSSTPKTVTVSGDADAGFTFSGLLAPTNGIFVDGHSDNRLIIAPDLVIPSRIDKMGAGSVEFTGAQTCSGGSGTYGWVFGQGQSVYSGSSSLTVTNASVGIGNAGYHPAVILTNQANWNVNRIEFGVSGMPATQGILYQDSDACSVTVPGQMIMGNLNSAGNTNAFYYLRKGTLAAYALTVGLNSPGRFEQSGGNLTVTSLNVKNGRFLLTGGDSVISNFAVGFAGLQPAVELAGGHMLLSGNMTTPWIPEMQAFAFSGGVLQVTNSCSCYIPMRLSATPTFDTPTPGIGLTLRAGLFGRATIVKTGSGAVGLSSGTTAALSGSLTISNGIFNMAANTVLESYAQSEEPLGVKICSGGIFRLTDINSVVTVPLALDIDAGGKIDFPYGTAHNRGIVVARSIITNGVSLPPGRYTTSHGFVTGASASCSVVIPINWAGSGDGVSWSDAANWEGGVVPNATTAVADLSNARQPVRIDGAVTLTCLAYNPQGAGRALTLTGSGSLMLSTGISVAPCVFVGPGRSLTLDVPLDRTPAGSTFGIVGGGTVIIKKKFPTMGAGQASAFSLYGDLVFAGVTSVDTFLGLWRHELNSTGSVIFTNGCQLSCTRILNNPSGFYPLRQVCHDGGNVLCGDVYFTRHNGDAAAPYTYFMRSGTLTTTNANGICLGVFYTGSWTRYSGGSFVMSGGTVNTARLALGMPDNVLDLHGGEVNLGSGGIISTTNLQGSIKLGGVALRATATWSSSWKMELTGVSGNMVMDTAGSTVTLGGALSGAGGLMKTGAGTLNLNGATNTFAGPLVVAGGTLTCGAASVFNGVTEITVTNGTLALNGRVLSPKMTLRVAGTGTVILPAGTDLEVDRLYLGGNLRPAGTYTFGSGTITVRSAGKIVWTGAAADGALWSTLNNWTNTIAVPHGAAVVLDFGCSQFAADDHIVLDVSPGVTLTNLIYDQGVPGCTLTLTCPEATTNTLTFPSNGVIRVEQGQTLVLDTDVFLSGSLYKYGMGTLVLNRRTYSDDVTGARTLFIMEGTVSGRGEINWIKVQPATASLMLPPPEFVLEGDRAVLRNKAFPLPGYWNNGNDQGVFTQKGGTVDLSAPPDAFTNSMIGFMIAGGGGTKGFYNLTGGTLVSCSNLNAYLSGNSASGTFNQSGGTSTFYRLNLTRPWSITGGSGVMNLSGGTLRLSGQVEKGYSAGSMNFSGGRVEAVWAGSMFAPDVPITLSTGEAGDVVFAQAQAAYTNTLPGTLAGTGGLVQAGPGTLALNGVNAFGGSVGVKGGTLLVNTALENATDLYADGGHLELLAEAPALTNLSVRAAGATVLIGGSATPFSDGLTLSLAQGIVTELDFDGIVDVHRLVLGGQAKSPGLYGGPGSSAPPKPSSVFFTGAGTLRVLYGPASQGTMISIR